MPVISDFDASRRFAPDRLRMLRTLAIRAAVGDPAVQATWLGIEQSDDFLDALQGVLIRVLHIDGEPIGYGTIKLGHLPRLVALYIHPAYQRRGHGQAMLTALADDLRASGACSLVTAAAAPALPFYLASGFQKRYAFSASPVHWDQGPAMCFYHMTRTIAATAPTH